MKTWHLIAEYFTRIPDNLVAIIHLDSTNLTTNRTRAKSKSHKKHCKLSKIQLMITGWFLMITGSLLDFLILHNSFPNSSKLSNDILNSDHDSIVHHIINPHQVKIPDFFKLNNEMVMGQSDIQYSGEPFYFDDEITEEDIDNLLSDLYSEYYDTSNEVWIDDNLALEYVSKQIERLLSNNNMRYLMGRFQERLREIDNAFYNLQNEMFEQNTPYNTYIEVDEIHPILS